VVAAVAAAVAAAVVVAATVRRAWQQRTAATVRPVRRHAGRPVWTGSSLLPSPPAALEQEQEQQQ